MGLPVPLDSTNSREHRGQLARAVTQLQKPRAAFMAYLNASTSNDKTGDGTFYNVVFDTIAFDTNGNYGSGVFTAKETGNYQFSSLVTVQNLQAAHTIFDVRLRLSTGKQYTIGYGGSYNSQDGGNFNARGGTIIIPLNAGDTVAVGVGVYGGTKVVGIDGTQTYFSGMRVT